MKESTTYLEEKNKVEKREKRYLIRLLLKRKPEVSEGGSSKKSANKNGAKIKEENMKNIVIGVLVVIVVSLLIFIGCGNGCSKHSGKTASAEKSGAVRKDVKATPVATEVAEDSVQPEIQEAKAAEIKEAPTAVPVASPAMNCHFVTMVNASHSSMMKAQVWTYGSNGWEWQDCKDNVQPEWVPAKTGINLRVGLGARYVKVRVQFEGGLFGMCVPYKEHMFQFIPGKPSFDQWAATNL